MSDLVEQIDALLALNAKGAVSHPVPGLAVDLLERAKAELSLRQSHSTGAVDSAVIHLTKAEVQSGHDRVKWAEGLIRQLPETHDGRNSWLINYGHGDDVEAMRDRHPTYRRDHPKPASPVHKDGEPVAHPDDEAVDRFAAAMKAKLAKKRAEGRGGWENKDEYSAAFLSSLLHGHVIKGDPVDVANLAMMLHQRGESILQTPNSAEKIGPDFVFSMRTHHHGPFRSCNCSAGEPAMTLNKDGLEAARNAVGTIPGAALWSAVEKAITAYLSVLPAPDGLVERLDQAVARCEEVLAHSTHEGLNTDFALMAKYRLSEAATVIQTLQRERDAFEVAMRNQWRPDVCPITGRRFFMWIDGEPTYGGPFDSYTIPTRDAEGEYFCRRYDHDEGGWKDWDEGVSIKVTEESDWLTLEDRAEAAEQQVRDMRAMVVRAQFNVPVVYANWHADARLLLKEGGGE